MSKRNMFFSTKYPAYHPRKGEPTYFVEKTWESIFIDHADAPEFEAMRNRFDIGLHNRYEPKHHTIRAGNRWKEGDIIMPRIWQLPGGMYTKGNKMMAFAPDMEVKKVWDITISRGDADGVIPKIAKTHYSNGMSHVVKMLLAENDDLTWQDFSDWFVVKDYQKPFTGQIVSWNDQINYASLSLPNHKEVNQ